MGFRSRWLPLCLLLIFPAISTSNLWAQNPVPFVNQPLVPASIAPGGPSFTLTVNGTGFVSGASINWNGSPLSTTFVSTSQLTASVPAANIASAGTATITVTNPSPGGGVSNAILLPVASRPAQLLLADALGSPVAVEYYPYSVATGDFNGDGKMDLAVVNACGGQPCQFNQGVFAGTVGTLSILLGKGDGTFSPAPGSPIAVGVLPNTVVVGDFNHDGKLDLAVVNGCGSDATCDTSIPTANGSVTILLGNGDGSFTPAPGSPVTVGIAPTSVALGDFNGDGKLDLAVTNEASNSVTVLLGNGDGSFTPAPGSPVAVANLPYAIAVVDFNRDGKLDLAVTNLSDLGESILLGNGDGTFAVTSVTSVGSGQEAVAVADFNGDGKLDLAIGGYGCGCAAILLGNGDGTFAGPYLTYPTDLGAPYSIVTGDFNGDGKLDLAMVGSNIVAILPGKGDGTFIGPPLLFATDDAFRSMSLALGDFNGDGRLDVATANMTSNNVSILIQVPPVRLSPGTLTFADQLVDTTSATQTVSLLNQGSTSLNITGIITVTGDFAIEPAGVTCSAGTSVPVNGNCTISLTFTPTALGTRTGTLSVSDNAANSPQTAALSGTGVNPAATLSATSLTFPSQDLLTTSAPMSVNLTNTGAGALTLSGIATTGAFEQKTNNCGTSVAQGASCTISVTFTPTTAGSQTGLLIIADNAANSPQTVSLSGVGVPPTITLNPSSLSFGAVAVGTTSAAQTITLTNNGPGPLAISDMTIQGPNASDFLQTNNCPASLAASASCTINISFKPSLNAPEFATLTMYDDAVSSPQTVALMGGLGPFVTLSPTNLTFAPQIVNTRSTTQSLTLTNSGNATLTISNVQVSPSAFTIQDNTCLPNTQVAPGSTCGVILAFQPSTTGVFTGTASVTDNAYGSPQTVALSGSGADFAISSNPTSATVAAGASATFTLSVTPAGGFNQTVNLSCTGAPSLSTCSVNPASVTLNGSSASTATVTITTTAPTGLGPRGPHPPGPVAWRYLLLLWLLALAAGAAAWRLRATAPLLLGGVPRLAKERTKGWWAVRDLGGTIRLALVAAVLACLLAACGGGGGNVTHTPGTPAGTYSLALTGTYTQSGSNLIHSTTVSLTVTQ